jgi:putative ABC transport system substrate-binding protein
MNRRKLVAALAAISILRPAKARAQQRPKIPTIGMLWHAGSAEEEGSYYTSLMEGFAGLGYLDGKSAHFEHRYADEHYDRFPALAAELVGLRVDVVMASILPAARAAQQATRTTPVVFVIVSDPVGTGLVSSLARPAGNLTGMSNVSEDLTAKRAQMFKEAVPSLRRVGLLFNSGGQTSPQVVDEYRAAAARFGFEVHVFGVRSPADIEAAFVRVSEMGLDGVATAPDSMIFNSRRLIAALATERRIPVAGHNLDMATAGALLAYGPDHADIFRRSAAVVDRILKGEKPAEIPVQQPVAFNTRINLRTAAALGIEIPSSLLARADEVIE